MMSSSMKSMGQDILDKSISFVFALGNRLNSNAAKYILKSSMKSFERTSENNVSFVYRPKATDKIASIRFEVENKTKVGIILQGPVMEENDFTLETVKLYRRIMPMACIILSSWKNTNPLVIEKFKELNIEVVLSSLPEYTGIGNVNYQVKTTQQGIRRAKELGVTHIMKTRTDQRLSQTNLLEFLDALIERFPIENPFYCKKQEERIIALQGSVGGNMFIPYFVPDFFFYGNINDIENFFDFPLQKVNQTRGERSKEIAKLRNTTVWEYYYNTAPEIQLTLDYLKRLGLDNLEISCEKWWEIVRDIFMFLSYDDVRFFWPKYDNHYDENFITMNFLDKDTENVKTYVWNFHNWFLIKTRKIVFSSVCDEFIKKKATVI